MWCLQEPLVQSGLLTTSDASGVITALAAAALDDATPIATAPSLPSRPSGAAVAVGGSGAGTSVAPAAGGVAPKGSLALSVAASPAVGTVASAAASMDGRGGGGLQDLDELALTVGTVLGGILQP